MKFLHDKRRAGVLALLSALTGAAALFLGTGAAEAGYPCNDETYPYPDTHATVGSGPNATYVGTSAVTNYPSGGYTFLGVFVCVAPTGGEADQKFVNVDVNEPPGSGTGATVETKGCNPVNLSSEYWTGGCQYTTAPTGVEVDPTTTTNAPLSGASGSGAEVGSGPGTCVYANSTTPSCPTGGATIGGVTVNEADLVPSVTPSTPTPPCTGVNNTCVPLGVTVRVFQDTSNPTATVDSGLTGSPPTNVDVAPTGTCVQVNATC